MFFQYYGHYKVLKTIDNIDDYDFIIKTRPDLLYEKFDTTLFNHDIFFPESHGGGGTRALGNINQLFFGGKAENMKQILNYFTNIIYFNNNMNYTIINRRCKTDINFNCLFRYYIFNNLEYQPFFTTYNPKIYRTKNLIVTIT